MTYIITAWSSWRKRWECSQNIVSMLSTLQDLFARLTAAPNESREDHEHTLQLAAAVLLVEVMRADPDIVAGERKAVIDGLRSRFALADDELARLVDLAESKV